jgi:hypothetical protein
MLARLLSALVALEVSSAAAAPRSLQLEGAAGYLSEWELAGTLLEAGSPAGTDFAGQVTWKHVGVCSPNGPVERAGAVRLRLSGGASPTRINVTLSFDGAQCVFHGAFVGRSSGYMDCPHAKGVPLSMTIR